MSLSAAAIKILEGAAKMCEGTVVNKIIGRVIRGEAKPVELKFVMDALDRYGNGNGKFELTDIVSFIGNRVQGYLDAGGTVAKLFAGDTLDGMFEGASNLMGGAMDALNSALESAWELIKGGGWRVTVARSVSDGGKGSRLSGSDD